MTRYFSDAQLPDDERTLFAFASVGIETTTCVRNIYKYYAAYKLTLHAQETRRRARGGVPAGGSAPR